MTNIELLLSATFDNYFLIFKPEVIVNKYLQFGTAVPHSKAMKTVFEALIFVVGY